MPRPNRLEVLENSEPIYTATVTKDGEIFPITNCILTFYVKTNASTPDSSPMFVYTIDDGIVITDAENGEAEIWFNKEDVEDPGVYWYHLDIQFADGRVEPIAYGLFTVVNV